MSPRSPADPEFLDSPVYWFVVLDTAKGRHDFELAAEAQRQLRRLGVRVTFRPEPKFDNPREVAHAS